MASSLIRSAHNATNSLHSLIYFAPETEHYLTGVGLRGNRMCYFAGRAAPMGAVGAGVVAATFYNFNPELVARSIPDAWELATPAAVIDARYVAVDAALTRLLGEDVIASADMLTLAGLVREAAGACTPEGRPLYAGNADLELARRPAPGDVARADAAARAPRRRSHLRAGLRGPERHRGAGHAHQDRQGIPDRVREGQPGLERAGVGRPPRPASRPAACSTPTAR